MYSQLIGIALFAASAFAQNSPRQDQSQPPRIAAELRARFWRTQAEAVAAAARAKQAQDAAKAAQDELQKQCGDQFVVALDADGEPSCQAKR